MDVLAELDENEVVLKVQPSLKIKAINNVRLIEGRLPERPDECVLEKGMNGSSIVPIGSTIKLQSGTDRDLSEDLKNTEYTVVGMVQTPYYLSFEKGRTNIGNGQIRAYIMIPEDNFKLEVYTDIYAIVEGAKDLNSYGDDYFPLIDKVTARLKDLARVREEVRYQEIIDEAIEEFKKGKEEYFREKAEGREKIS